MRSRQEWLIREASAAEDTRCGVIFASALSTTSLALRLPGARHMFENDSPFPLGRHSRLVAEAEGIVVGFVDYSVDEGRIRSLYVHARWQRLGVGSALLEHAERDCAVEPSLSLLRANEGALRWYFSRGYRMVNSRVDWGWRAVPAEWLELRKESVKFDRI
jgi:GNAT superfamily N-acetyltransferase